MSRLTVRLPSKLPRPFPVRQSLPVPRTLCSPLDLPRPAHSHHSLTSTHLPIPQQRPCPLSQEQPRRLHTLPGARRDKESPARQVSMALGAGRGHSRYGRRVQASITPAFWRARHAAASRTRSVHLQVPALSHQFSRKDSSFPSGSLEDRAFPKASQKQEAASRLPAFLSSSISCFLSPFLRKKDILKPHSPPRSITRAQSSDDKLWERDLGVGVTPHVAQVAC